MLETTDPPENVPVVVRITQEEAFKIAVMALRWAHARKVWHQTPRGTEDEKLFQFMRKQQSRLSALIDSVMDRKAERLTEARFFEIEGRGLSLVDGKLVGREGSSRAPQNGAEEPEA